MRFADINTLTVYDGGAHLPAGVGSVTVNYQTLERAFEDISL